MAVFLLLQWPIANAQQEMAPPPDQFEAARLVWTTLIAVDQANRTGNYSVLRDLGSPRFREANDAARLAGIFANIRGQNLALDRTVLLTPIYDEPPAVRDDGMLRIRGSFVTRPVGVAFDMLFEPLDGEWRLFGIGIGSKAMPMPVPLPRPLNLGSRNNG